MCYWVVFGHGLLVLLLIFIMSSETLVFRNFSVIKYNFRSKQRKMGYKVRSLFGNTGCKG